jgi:signal transduction histidine kinase
VVSSPEFYDLLSSLFQQMASSSQASPVVPLDRYPPGSAEHQLLTDLQTALQARSQDRQAQAEESQRQNRLRQQWMEARMREQATLLEISQILASALELKPGLILDQLREIIEYTHATLFALEEMDLVALAVRGPQQPAQTMSSFRTPLAGRKMLAMLLDGQRPTRVADIHKDEPSAQLLRTLLGHQADGLLADLHGWMWVPLAVQGRVMGGLSIVHAKADAFTAHHADLALTMANQAAITMVNAHLYAQAQTLATLEERQRLARDLHDAVNQSLFPAGLIADVLPRLWQQDPEEGRQSLADLRRLIRGAQAELRGLLVELRPIVLTDTKLEVLLRQLADALSGRTDIPVVVSVTGESVLPGDVQITLYRICQEALSNVAKHANASQVSIQLQMEAGALDLRIYDDGCGFDPGQSASGRHGLSIMRERAAAIGAGLSIASQPGHGAEIVVRWRGGSPQEDRHV